MDREKLNKAAYEETNTGNPYEQFDTWYVRESFKHGADWLMQQPIQERLTEAEKERIIKRYKDELEVAQHHSIKMKESTNPTSRQFHANVREGYISRLKLLEQIFGPDLFKEK